MIPRTKVNYGIGDLVRAAFTRESGMSHARELVDELRALTGCRHVLLTASGRGALFAILRALDRDRVLIPAYTCKAVDEAAVLAGKTIVHVPTEPDGFNFDSSALGGIVDERSIIVATHQFGIPCDMDTTMRIAREHGAVVVEDAAASLGTRIEGRLTGTIGDVGFFSFDSTKLVTVPLKGGFIATNDDDLARRMQHVIDDEMQAPGLVWKARTLVMAAILVMIENGFLYGLFHWLVFARRGIVTFDDAGLHAEFTEFYRHRLTNWQAQIALRQIRRLDDIVRVRQTRYRQLQEGLVGIRRGLLPPIDTENAWACIRFPLRVRDDKLGYYRELNNHGVDCAFSFTYIANPDADELATRIADEVLDLPYYEKLTDKELQAVIDAVVTIDSQGDSK